MDATRSALSVLRCEKRVSRRRVGATHESSTAAGAAAEEEEEEVSAVALVGCEDALVSGKGEAVLQTGSSC